MCLKIEMLCFSWLWFGLSPLLPQLGYRRAPVSAYGMSAKYLNRHNLSPKRMTETDSQRVVEVMDILLDENNFCFDLLILRWAVNPSIPISWTLERRLTGIPFYYPLARGQEVKLISQLFRRILEHRTEIASHHIVLAVLTTYATLFYVHLGAS